MNPTESTTKPGGIGQKAQEAAHAAAETIKSRATEAGARVKETANEMVEQRRGQMADRIGSVGSALEETARSAEAEDPNLAWLTNQASSRLQQAADYVRSCSWQQLRDDSASFARRHPVAFFGGMFALGAAAGALIKAGMAGARESTDGLPAHEPERELPPESDVTLSPGTEEPYVAPTATI